MVLGYIAEWLLIRLFNAAFQWLPEHHKSISTREGSFLGKERERQKDKDDYEKITSHEDFQCAGLYQEEQLPRAFNFSRKHLSAVVQLLLVGLYQDFVPNQDIFPVVVLHYHDS